MFINIQNIKNNKLTHSIIFNFKNTKFKDWGDDTQVRMLA